MLLMRASFFSLPDVRQRQEGRGGFPESIGGERTREREREREIKGRVCLVQVGVVNTVAVSLLAMTALSPLQGLRLSVCVCMCVRVHRGKGLPKNSRSHTCSIHRGPRHSPSL